MAHYVSEVVLEASPRLEIKSLVPFIYQVYLFSFCETLNIFIARLRWVWGKGQID